MRFLLLLALSVVSAFAAPYVLPPERRVNWVLGTDVGVIGGIPTRTTTVDVTASPYYAANNNTSTTGAISSASSSLVVASATNFSAHQGIQIGFLSTQELTITGGATASDYLVISLVDQLVYVMLTAGDTPSQVATKIRANRYWGYTVSGTGGVVRWTSLRLGTRNTISTSTNGAGITGTYAIIQAGSLTLSTTITSISGTTFTLGATSPTTVSGATVFHDSLPAIQAAVDAAGADGVVYCPAGTYQLSGSLRLKSTMSLRGAGVSTILDFRGASGAILIGGVNLGANTPITGGVSKGSTRLNVSDSSGFAANQILLVDFPGQTDNAAINAGDPVGFAVAAPPLWRQMTRVTGTGTGYVDIFPGLFNTYGNGSLSGNLSKNQTTNVNGTGLEDILIDCSNSSVQTAVGVEASYNCWTKNVTCTGYVNYAIFWQFCINCESVKCSVYGPGAGATNHSGYLLNFCSAVAVYDCISRYNGPDIEVNFGSCGCFVAYNFFADNFVSLDANHAPQNGYNLYEGNVATQVSADGYFGGNNDDTFHRNWFFGKDLTTGGPAYTTALNRGTVFDNMIGNVLGISGVTTSGAYSFGNPNIGNGSSSGVASFYTSAATLTTRTSNTVGTITATTGHGITTGATIDVAWVIDFTAYQVAYVRRGVLVGTVSGNTIPFSGGLGDVLPSASSAVYIPSTNLSLIHPWNDWLAGGTLTTRTDTTNGVMTMSKGACFVGEYFFNLWPGNTVVNFGVVQAVSGNQVTFQNFSGPNLPPTSTIGRVWMGSGGYQELDLDVLWTVNLKSNFLASVSGIPAVEAFTGGTTLANSYSFASKPAWFYSLSWPPIDPNSPPTADPTTAWVVPAVYRYYNGNVDPPPDSTVGTPYFSPDAGTYGSSQSVQILDGTAGCTIYYTTNGATPTTSSPVYSTALTISSTTTLKAFAVKAGLTDSAVNTGIYTIAGTVATPTFSPVAGTYTSGQSVTLACSTSGATIYYTNDGTPPTTSSSVYSTPITVAVTTTLKALATKATLIDSSIATGVFTISAPAGPTTTISGRLSPSGTIKFP